MFRLLGRGANWRGKNQSGRGKQRPYNYGIAGGRKYYAVPARYHHKKYPDPDTG
jgi:hypothetical protein